MFHAPGKINRKWFAPPAFGRGQSVSNGKVSYPKIPIWKSFIRQDKKPGYALRPGIKMTLGMVHFASFSRIRSRWINVCSSNGWLSISFTKGHPYRVFSGTNDEGRNILDKCVVEWCVGTLWYRLWREEMGYAFLKGVRDRRCGTLCTPRV